MPDMSSEKLILALETIFSESGVPNILITDNERQYCSKEFNQFSPEWSFIHKTSSPYDPKGNSYAEEIYSKCKDNFLLGLLVHWSTPLLYSNKVKSPAEMFLGQKIATNIPYIPFGTAALMQCPRNDDHEHRFEPQAGDSCYAKLNPMENVWEKGFIVRKVIGVPDSDNHDVLMATGVMPTLCPRPQMKFPKLPVQATQQEDFNL